MPGADPNGLSTPKEAIETGESDGWVEGVEH